MCHAMDHSKNEKSTTIRVKNQTFLQKIFRLSAVSVSGPASKPPCCRDALPIRLHDLRGPRVSDVHGLRGVEAVDWRWLPIAIGRL